ncbi:hypothetical protein [Caulobacter segnis]|uniref:Uncharacterized protein n=1 Tax=Caulobacter segnis (strain ATCC 21756 / DSM 7131 / JCM 7823 / NBRC 15250 / LMG 17158 / TK0059) TaxID=509190 RepID=D5VHY0_CAUST|nr:hypothetical protein [Caulobacter segnis]ADG09233.1 conserved hypothetical protein [Caulobacter segnis ATCC 21756]
MSQTQTPAAPSPRQWCDAIQAKLMAALDEAWRIAESSDDPAVQARARDKAKLCAQMAAAARKIAAMSPPAKTGKAGPEHPLDLIQDFVRRMDKATTAIEAAEEPAPEPQPRAAQAVAMQAALAKLKRR